METTVTSLQLKGLGRKAMTELTSKAKRLGITPERYVKELVREDLALDRRARTTTFYELLGPGREVDEAELDELVDAARTRHYQRTGKRKSAMWAGLSVSSLTPTFS